MYSLKLLSELGLVAEVGLLVLVWVVLLCVLALDVVLIVHSLGALVSTLLGLVGIVLVHALGLGPAEVVSVWLPQARVRLNLQLVNLTTHKAHEELFGKLMGNHLACECLISS